MLNNRKSERLNSAVQRLDNVEHEFQNLQQRLNQFRQDRVETSTIAPQPDYWDVGSSIHALQDQLQQVDIRTNQYLANQSEYYESQVENIQAELWAQNTDQLEQQGIWLEDTISAEYAHHLSQVNQLREALAAAQQGNDRRMEFSRNSLESAQALFNELQERYHSEPGWQTEIDSILFRLEQSRSNLDNGFDEASLTGSQQIYQHLTELLQYFEQFIQHRQDSIAVAQASAHEVLQFIQQNQRVQAVNLEGSLLPTDLEVDFWSDGRLRLLNRQARRILHHLQSPPYMLTLDEISHLGKELIRVREQIPDVVQDARVQVLSSQMRFSVAECVLTALRTQGYELSFGGFLWSDMRNPYQMTMGNLGGSQVFVTVSQIPQQPLNQFLELETNDQEALSEFEIRRRSDEIETALSLFGLNVGLITGPDSVFNPVVKNRRQASNPGWQKSRSPQPARIEYQSK